MGLLTDDLHKKAKAMAELKKTLPPVIGNMGTRHFVASFTNQGFDNNGVEKWKEVKRRISGTPEFKYPKKKDLGRHERPILIGKSGGSKSGAHAHLRQSVNTSLKEATWENILFSVPQPYAQRHNDGLDGMPKRQFIGNSASLIAKIQAKLDSEMSKILKG